MLLRGVSLLSVQVTREWRVRSADCAAGSLEIRRAGVVVPKWNDDSDRSCEFLGKTLQ